MLRCLCLLESPKGAFKKPKMPLQPTLRDSNVIILGWGLVSILLKAPQVILKEQLRFRTTDLDGTLSEGSVCSQQRGTGKERPSLGMQRSGKTRIWEESYVDPKGNEDHVDTWIIGI